MLGPWAEAQEFTCLIWVLVNSDGTTEKHRHGWVTGSNGSWRDRHVALSPGCSCFQITGRVCFFFLLSSSPLLSSLLPVFSTLHVFPFFSPFFFSSFSSSSPLSYLSPWPIKLKFLRVGPLYVCMYLSIYFNVSLWKMLNGSKSRQSSIVNTHVPIPSTVVDSPPVSFHVCTYHPPHLLCYFEANLGCSKISSIPFQYVSLSNDVKVP